MEPQARLSQLLNGKIANKSVEKLLYYAGRLGMEARATFAQTPKDTKIWLKKEHALANWHLVSSKEDLKAFPEAIQDEIGTALSVAQFGGNTRALSP